MARPDPEFLQRLKDERKNTGGGLLERPTEAPQRPERPTAPRRRGELLDPKPPTTGKPKAWSPEPDDYYREQARRSTEHWEALKGMDFSRDDMLPSINDDQTSFQDVANFLFGDEMNAVGLKLDDEQLKWKLETFTTAWGEHPVRSAWALGSLALPVIGKMAKVKIASKLLSVTPEQLKGFGLIDNTDDFLKLGERHQDMVKYQAMKLAESQTLESKVLGNTATAWEKKKYQFNAAFGNTFTEMIDGGKDLNVRTGYIKRMHKILEGEEMLQHLDTLPDARWGPRIARYLHDANPRHLDTMPDDAQIWAKRFRDSSSDLQQKAVSEGLVKDDALERIGDVWFSTVRKGTDLGTEGATTTIFGVGKAGKLIAQKVPRGKSPFLMHREATRAQVGQHIRRQDALQLLDEQGDRLGAIKALDKSEDAEIRMMIARGDDNEAVAKLSELGELDLAPETLTTKGMLQQRLLLENYRYLRDVAMNPQIVRSKEQIGAMTKAVQKKYIPLESMGGQTTPILKRMVAKAQGIPEGQIGELGYVHKDLFRELTSINTGMPAQSQSALTFLELGTAVHKTMKTGLNPYTHAQNVAGNFMFLSMAGMNPFSPNNWKTLRKSWKAVRDMQDMTRGNIDEARNLGKLKSVIGGKDLDFAEELASAEARQIVEESSMSAAEGLGVIERMSKRIDENAQAPMAAIAKMMQKGTAIKSKRAPWLSIEGASDAYMAEDSMFKFGYFMKLRQEGLSRSAAALEVSRRLPMYHTVGGATAGLRKFTLPWLSFPAESARIMKNNMMDYPLRTAAWMHMTEGVSALMYPGVKKMGPDTRQATEEAKKGLPMWAQRPVGTVVTPWRDSNDDIRAMVLDFMPYATFMPPTEAKEAPFMQKYGFFGADQPFPILGGMMQAITGNDQWGREIAAKDGKQRFTKALVNTAGFMAPPIMQKYMMNTSAPTNFWRMFQDAGIRVNPATVKPGVPILDMALNNTGVFGFGKAYASSPEQRLSNEKMASDQRRAYRARLWRDYNAYARSGLEDGVYETLRDLNGTYAQEWDDPAVAQRKYSESLIDHQADLRKHPKLRSMTKEQMVERLGVAKESFAQNRSRSAADMVDVLRQEITMRGATSNSGSINPMTGRRPRRSSRPGR